MHFKNRISHRNSVHPIDVDKQEGNNKQDKGKKYKKSGGNNQPEKITIINHVSGGDSAKELPVPNEELSFRNLSVRIRGLHRLHSYFDAPIIKFLNHFVI